MHIPPKSTPSTNFCISYASLPVVRHHGHGNLSKKEFDLAYGVRVSDGRVKVWWQVGGAAAERLHFDLQREGSSR